MTSKQRNRGHHHTDFGLASMLHGKSPICLSAPGLNLLHCRYATQRGRIRKPPCPACHWAQRRFGPEGMQQPRQGTVSASSGFQVPIFSQSFPSITRCPPPNGHLQASVSHIKPCRSVSPTEDHQGEDVMKVLIAHVKATRCFSRDIQARRQQGILSPSLTAPGPCAPPLEMSPWVSELHQAHGST